jgi:hypothetical protein
MPPRVTLGMSLNIVDGNMIERLTIGGPSSTIPCASCCIFNLRCNYYGNYILNKQSKIPCIYRHTGIITCIRYSTFQSDRVTIMICYQSKVVPNSVSARKTFIMTSEIDTYNK